MEDQTQKILSLQEEIISLQKTSYHNSLETVKKVENYKKTNMSLLIIAFLSLLYGLVLTLFYYK